MSIHLVGGGLSAHSDAAVFGPFVAEALRRTPVDGGAPRILVVTVREDAAAHAQQLIHALRAAGPIDAEVVALAEGAVLDPSRVEGVDGIVVGGGLTPAYLAALAPTAAGIRGAVERGVPYLGFSAGAAIASSAALIGGWRIGGVPVCPEDAAEELDEVTFAAGLGLVDVSIDVHAAQWGTLARLIAATEAGLTSGGVAIDESTALVVGGGPLAAVGAGSVWTVVAVEGGVRVATIAADDPDAGGDDTVDD